MEAFDIKTFKKGKPPYEIELAADTDPKKFFPPILCGPLLTDNTLKYSFRFPSARKRTAKKVIEACGYNEDNGACLGRQFSQGCYYFEAYSDEICKLSIFPYTLAGDFNAIEGTDESRMACYENLDVLLCPFDAFEKYLDVLSVTELKILSRDAALYVKKANKISKLMAASGQKPEGVDWNIYNHRSLIVEKKGLVKQQLMRMLKNGNLTATEKRMWLETIEKAISKSAAAERTDEHLRTKEQRNLISSRKDLVKQQELLKKLVPKLDD